MANLFTFPEAHLKKKRRSYPFEVEEGKITFAFIEVGCQHRKKRSQLKNKKELFLKYWGDHYKATGDVDWVPRIYRVMSHYNRLDHLPREYNKYSVDAIIHHKYITPEQIRKLSEFDIGQIKHVVKKKDEQQVLEEILATSDAKRMQDLILHTDEQNKYSTLRGKMAEILTQQAIHEAIKEDIETGEIISYYNGHIKYFNKRFDNGAEVDQILQFYGDQAYNNLLFSLSKKDNLAISLDTQPIS